ncbi:YdcF family protein [Acinetobacter nectaris]|uniref:YdcF family protein n=1 Tax=Acinetobacter nectaris TaxID=1219382 RepID=UPI001F1891F5|nr:YdcF family protein [Acinetobacter nectaris]MCF9046061.1 YdcF family protein [Acinetobacter nectaris]
MAKKQPFMVRLVKVIAVLAVLLTAFIVFIYTPFYSKSILFLLNHFVPIEVNMVAAKSQQIAALSEHDDLEPGSHLWIARQAYLKILQETAQREDAANLNLVEARYKILEQQLQKKEDEDDTDDDVSELVTTENKASSEFEPKAVENIANLNDLDTNVLMHKYSQFLTTYPVKVNDKDPISQQVSQDLQQANSVRDEQKADASKPSAIVVLGGGLTFDRTARKIVVNNYTRLRLEKTLEVEQQNNLPIVLSGVEAPYMQIWLKDHGVDAKLLENRSMNTCENSRFSSLLLQKKGGAPQIMLVTDEYHMPRTRRLFAQNGIATIPVDAPMPTALTSWKPALSNYDHSRRANYELLATMRDVIFGTNDCREVP